jgi:ATP-dependent Clp protease ATP-binding subunit ClpA
VIQSHLENTLAEAILAGKFISPCVISVDYQDGHLTFVGK